jgi:hypothetical protein
MAHFAQLNENDTVTQVIVVNNNELLDENGIEQEEKGISFCRSLLGGNWIQTSYNAKFRKNYAGVDYTYDSVLDAFIPPKPFNSWLLNTDTCQWYPPVPYPDDGKNYMWNESIINWIEIQTQ